MITSLQRFFVFTSMLLVIGSFPSQVHAESDLEKARACAEAGHTICEVFLGKAYLNGTDGAAQDVELASHWLNIATNKGNIEAALLLETLNKIPSQTAPKPSGVSDQEQKELFEMARANPYVPPSTQTSGKGTYAIFVILYIFIPLISLIVSIFLNKSPRFNKIRLGYRWGFFLSIGFALSACFFLSLPFVNRWKYYFTPDEVGFLFFWALLVLPLAFLTFRQTRN